MTASYYLFGIWIPFKSSTTWYNVDDFVFQGMEEGADHYERTNKLLESVCEASQPKIFYGSLWECIASNASARLPAVTFLLQHLDRRTPIIPDQLHLFGTGINIPPNSGNNQLESLIVVCVEDF